MNIEQLSSHIDLIWIPIAGLIAQKHQKIKAMLFCLCCSIFLRLQIDMLGMVGYPNGVFGIMHAPLYTRGLIVYSAMITLYLVLTVWSPRTRGFIFMAASLSLFFMAALISSVILIL
jgi:hypothetical protein